MYANLVSKFLNAFPKEKPLDPPTPQYETWTIAQPLQTLTFQDHAWAVQWCHEQGVDLNQLQHHVQPLDSTHLRGLENLFDLQRQGHAIGSLQPQTMQDLPSRYLDDFMVWFETEPKIMMTGSLVKLAFASNRIDVAQRMGFWIQKTLPAWITPLQPPAFEDPEMIHRANGAFMEAMEDLMMHAREMQWLFEHNPALKTTLLAPNSWAKFLDKCMDMEPRSLLLVPNALHTVFQQSLRPTHQEWPISHPSHFWRLMTSFAHDPAAQCSLVQQAHQQQYLFEEWEPGVFESFNEGGFIAPQAMAFMHQLTGQGPLDDSPLTAVVHFLEMGMGPKVAPDQFYEHARSVLAPINTATIALPELDGTAPGMW